MTRKIAFLVRSLNIGGAERQLIELADGLQRAGWTVKIVTFYAGSVLEPEIAQRGIVVVSKADMATICALRARTDEHRPRLFNFRVALRLG